MPCHISHSAVVLQGIPDVLVFFPLISHHFHMPTSLGTCHQSETFHAMIGHEIARASWLPLLHAIHLDLLASRAPQAQPPLHGHLRSIVNSSTITRAPTKTRFNWLFP
ncbi:Uncharacterized protein HZ326_8834 [Fusarium oxysporum f. sp. albedinis]|nr:Uncharacterized protein HZ326_8834 [Fusarium oxysporum f. sp. albedinis]